MVANQEYYSGISLLPRDGSEYVQMPFTECAEQEYHELSAILEGISLDMNQLRGYSGQSQTQELACSGGSCEII